MADEFERVMSLMLDRMEAKLREIEACDRVIEGLRMNARTKQAEDLDGLKSKLREFELKPEFIQQRLDFANKRLTDRSAQDQKLSELWYAADAIRSKANEDVTAADRQRLAKALDEAQVACDLIPF